MKFCDKLAKMRKNNNLSQEQFADKLGVSRQAVSKWESGQSIPDMEKIIYMCKILNCNLDDLLDDGVIGKSPNNTKLNLMDYFNEFLSFITKSYNMFWSMKFKEKLKCIFELIFIFIVLLLVGMAVNYLFSDLVLDNLYFIPIVGSFLSRLLSILAIIALVCVGIIIFIHLFKIRYLDYFVTVEDNSTQKKEIEKELPEEKIIDNKRYIIENKREKIVIRDSKHSSYNFLSVLGKIILYIIKFFVAFIAIPCIFFTVAMVILTAMSIYYFQFGSLFFFVFICLIGCLLFCYIVLYFIYNFIFNLDFKFKQMFILFIISLCLIGIGFGLSLVKYMDYDRIGILEEEYKIEEFQFDMNDNLLIDPYYDVEYIIDNSISNIKIEVKYFGKEKINVSKYSHINSLENYSIIDIYTYDLDLLDTYKIFKDDLKNHVIRDFDREMYIKVFLSEDNYNILKQNEKRYFH